MFCRDAYLCASYAASDVAPLLCRIMFSDSSSAAPSPMHSSRFGQPRNWTGLHASARAGDNLSSEAIRRAEDSWSSEAIRAAGKAELDRMKGPDLPTAPRSLRAADEAEAGASEQAPASSGWGLSLLLPTLPSIQWPQEERKEYDPHSTFIITNDEPSSAMGSRSSDPRSGVSHVRDITIDLGAPASDALPYHQPYHPVPPSPDHSASLSQRSSSSAIKDRFRENLKKLEKYKH